jgi:hypothetical protein
VKEIYTAVEKTFLSIPENFRDWATVRIAEYFLQLGPGHGFKTNKGRRWGKKIMDYWYQGKVTLFSEFAEGMFDGFHFNFYGLDNLSTDGAEILVVNEPSTGPIRGNWIMFLINFAIAEQRRREGNYEARWVQREISDNLIFQITPLGIQKRHLSQMICKSCNTILVDPCSSPRENLKAVLEMRQHLQDDGVLIICPEGKNHRVLGRGKKEAGELVLMLVRKVKVPVRPVGVWDEGDDLNLRFGEIINLDSLTGSGQRVADLATTEIAKLLPPERRGVYQKAV